MRRETMRSPILHRIAEALGIQQYAVVGLLECIRLLNIEQRLETLTPEEISGYVFWPRRRSAVLFELLLLHGVVFPAPMPGRFCLNRKFFSPARPHISVLTRAVVMERDGRRCRRCGSTDRLALDHIHPYALGGPDTVENLQVLCIFCNTDKGCSIQ